MLVQKGIMSKRSKILLIVLLVILIPGGFLIYYYRYGGTKQEEAPFLPAEMSVERRVIIPKFDSEIFDDSQFLDFKKKLFAGFTDQVEGIVLDEDEPLAPVDVSVFNPAVGQKLVVRWQLPEHINFNKVKVYRSKQIGYLGENIVTLDVDASRRLMSYQDTDLTNGMVYYYLVRMVNRTEEETEDDQGPIPLYVDNESKNTAQAIGIPTDAFPPDPPDNVRVQSLGESRIKISWINPTNSDFNSIRVYRSQQRGVVGDLVESDDTGQSLEDDDTIRHYMIDTIASNATYYYTVTSVDNSGNESTKDILAAPYKYNPFEPIEF